MTRSEYDQVVRYLESNRTFYPDNYSGNLDSLLYKFGLDRGLPYAAFPEKQSDLLLDDNSLQNDIDVFPVSNELAEFLNPVIYEQHGKVDLA